MEHIYWRLKIGALPRCGLQISHLHPHRVDLVDPPSAKVKDFPAFLRIGNSRAFAGLSRLGSDQGYGTTATSVLPPWRVL